MTGDGGENNGAGCADPCACDSKERPKDHPKEHHKETGDVHADSESGKPRQELPDAKSELDECRDKLARTMADYENMMRQKDHDVALRVTAGVISVMGDVIRIHDDLVRAHDALVGSGNLSSGLDGILKNISALLARNNVVEIDALGEHFDPSRHESIKVVDDDTLDDGTITKVIRKGYIYQNQVLRPSLVEISRRSSG